MGSSNLEKGGKLFIAERDSVNKRFTYSDILAEADADINTLVAIPRTNIFPNADGLGELVYGFHPDLTDIDQDVFSIFFKRGDYLKTKGIGHKCVFLKNRAVKRYFPKALKKLDKNYQIRQDVNDLLILAYEVSYDVPIDLGRLNGFNCDSFASRGFSTPLGRLWMWKNPGTKITHADITYKNIQVAKYFKRVMDRSPQRKTINAYLKKHEKLGDLEKIVFKSNGEEVKVSTVVRRPNDLVHLYEIVKKLSRIYET